VAESNSDTETQKGQDRARPGGDEWALLEQRLWKGGFLIALILIALAIFRSGGRHELAPPGWGGGPAMRFQQFGPMPPPPPWAFGHGGPGGFEPPDFSGRPPR
jgi:hypothetical protein